MFYILLVLYILFVLVPAFYALGYFVVGPMLDGFKPFTSPSQAADYYVLGRNADRRLRRSR